MDTAKFKDVSIGVSCLGLLICAAFAVHVYHTTGLLGSKVSLEIAGTAVQIRKDTSDLEQHASKVLTETSTLVATENEHSSTQLAALQDQQAEFKALLKKGNIIADAIIGVHGHTGILGGVNADVESLGTTIVALGAAVNENSTAAKNTLAAVQNAIGPIGPAVNSAKTLVDNAAGVIGAPGTTQGLAGAVDTLNAAGKNLTLVGANVASVIGQPGQPGTVGRIVSNVDQAIQDATHPEKLPFWKMVLERFLVPEIPAVVHDVFTRWIHPRQDVYILNSTAQSQPVTSTPAKKVQP